MASSAIGSDEAEVSGTVSSGSGVSLEGMSLDSFFPSPCSI